VLSVSEIFFFRIFNLFSTNENRPELHSGGGLPLPACCRCRAAWAAPACRAVVSRCLVNRLSFPMPVAPWRCAVVSKQESRVTQARRSRVSLEPSRNERPWCRWTSTRPASCVRCAMIRWRRRACLPPTTMPSSSFGRTEMSWLCQQCLKGQLLEPRRQRREEHAGAAEERAKREARLKQAAGVQAGQPLTMAEPEHVSGKTGSHALQGSIATHVHITEAQGDLEDSQCFIL
jgi:hypothetical protein